MMARIWEQNEEISEDEELVTTEQRDEPRGEDRDVPLDEPLDEPAAERTEQRVEPLDSGIPQDERFVETTADAPREALEELGEDVASSPARRSQPELPDQ